MAGLADFFAALNRHQLKYVLATNNATNTAAQYVQKLSRFGLDIPAWRIVNSAEATASHLSGLVAPGSPVYVVGESGLRQAMTERGFDVTVGDDSRPVVAVVVGLHRQVCYEDLAQATLHIRSGALFLGTNPDPTIPTPRGELPGAGALLALLEAATNVRPAIIGKPGRALFDEALRRLDSPPERALMVGDRLATDIVGAHAAGLATVMVLSGVTTEAELEGSPIQPDWIVADIVELTARLAEITGVKAE
jgi:4-nitrophenyl phosphatase